MSHDFHSPMDNQRLSNPRIKQAEGSIVRPAPSHGSYRPRARALAAVPVETRAASPVRFSGSVHLDRQSGSLHVERHADCKSGGSVSIPGLEAAPVVRQAAQVVPLQSNPAAGVATGSRQPTTHAPNSLQQRVRAVETRLSNDFISIPDTIDNETDMSAVIQFREHLSSPGAQSPKIIGHMSTQANSVALHREAMPGTVGGLRRQTPPAARHTVELSTDRIPSMAAERFPSNEQIPSITPAELTCEAPQLTAMPQFQIEELIEQRIEQRIDQTMESISAMSKHAEERFAHGDASIAEVRSAWAGLRCDVEALHSRFLGFFQDSQAAQNQMAQQSEERIARSEACTFQLMNDSSELRHEIDILRTRIMEFADMKNQHRTVLSAIHAQNEQHQRLEARHEELRQQTHHESQPCPSKESSLATSEEIMHLRREVSLITMSASNNTESILDFNRKCEDVWRVLDAIVNRLPSVSHEASKLVCVEELERERHERIHGASEFTALVHELRREVFASMNASFTELSTKLNRRADEPQRDGVVVDERHLESSVAKAMHPEREAWTQALARAVEAERTTRTQDIEQEQAARKSETATLHAAMQQLSSQVVSSHAPTGDVLLREEVERCLDSQQNQMNGMESRLSDFMSDIVSRLSRDATPGGTCDASFAEEVARERQARTDSHCELAAAIGRVNIVCEDRCNELERKLSEAARAVPTGGAPMKQMPLRIPLDVEREHCVEHAQKDVDVAALREDVDCLTEVWRKEVESLHDGMELLAGQVHQQGPQAPHGEFHQLAEALQEEVGTRCANDEFLQQELTELGGKVDELWHGFEAISAESQSHSVILQVLRDGNPHMQSYPPTSGGTEQPVPSEPAHGEEGYVDSLQFVDLQKN